MKIFTNKNNAPMRIRDVTISVSSQAELQQIANFLLTLSQMAPDHWAQLNHRHFIDSPQYTAGAEDIIIVNGAPEVPDKGL